MAVMISPSVMRLGVIKRDDKLYMAYLHFRDDKGDECNLTPLMVKAQKGFAELWQEAAKTLGGRVQNCEFFENGFISHGSAVRTEYSEQATKDAVKRFFDALKTPQFCVPTGASIEEVDLEGFGDGTVIAAGICAKFEAIGDKPKIEEADEQLTELEKDFLWKLRYKNLYEGIKDLNQLNDLREIKHLGF
jgi:hypothetical protein